MLALTPKSGILREFPPANRYLLGLSGGRDSVALLDALVESGYKNLVVCHLNHQLRGRASEADAKFAKDLAGKYGLEFELGSADVRRLARKWKKSLETAARQAR